MLAVIEYIENESDREKVAQWYIKYQNIMNKIVYDMTSDYDIAPDMINETFVKIIRHLDIVLSLDDPERNVYMMNTLKNTVIDYLKKQNKRGKTIDCYSDFTQLDKEDIHMNPESTYERKEFYSEMYKYMEQLTERDKMLIAYKYAYQMSIKEISDITGIKENHIPIYIQRARKRLIKFLNGGDLNE